MWPPRAADAQSRERLEDRVSPLREHRFARHQTPGAEPELGELLAGVPWVHTAVGPLVRMHLRNDPQSSLTGAQKIAGTAQHVEFQSLNIHPNPVGQSTRRDRDIVDREHVDGLVHAASGEAAEHIAVRLAVEGDQLAAFRMGTDRGAGRGEPRWWNGIHRDMAFEERE